MESYTAADNPSNKKNEKNMPENDHCHVI